MKCIKCGRETKDGALFCQDCLAGMEAYPVKPGTPIQLPSHPEPAPVRKRPVRYIRPVKPEELEQLRSSKRWLTAALVITLIAFIFAAALVFLLLWQKGPASLPFAN